MPKYLWKASYTTKGVRSVANEGEAVAGMRSSK